MTTPRSSATFSVTVSKIRASASSGGWSRHCASGSLGTKYLLNRLDEMAGVRGLRRPATPRSERCASVRTNEPRLPDLDGLGVHHDHDHDLVVIETGAVV